MTKEIINEVFPALVAIGAGLFGALFVGYVNHLLTKDRERVTDRERRRREFHAFIVQWRSRMALPLPNEFEFGMGGVGVVKREFSKSLPDFHHAASLAYGCFELEKIEVFTKKIGGLELSANNQEARKPFLDAIDELLNFIGR